MCKAKLPGIKVCTGRSSGVLECTNKFDWGGGQLICLFVFIYLIYCHEILLFLMLKPTRMWKWFFLLHVQLNLKSACLCSKRMLSDVLGLVAKIVLREASYPWFPYIAPTNFPKIFHQLADS